MAVISTIQINTGTAKKSISDLEKELQSLNEQLKSVDINSDNFKKLSKQVSETQLELNKVNETISNSSISLTDMSGSVAEVTNALVGGFTAAQGALNLFGVESEDVLKSIQKLQSLMAIGQGIDQITKGIKAFQKLTTAIKASTVVQSLFNKNSKATTALTKADTVATTANTVAKKAGTVATVAATAATTAFGIALKAIGIGLIIGAINLLVAGLEKLANLLKKNNPNSYLETLKTRLEEVSERLQNFKDYYDIQKENNSFVNSLSKASQAILKTQIELSKYNVTFKEYTNNLREFAKYSGDQLQNSAKNLLSEAASQLPQLIEILDAVEGLPYMSGSVTESIRNQLANMADQTSDIIVSVSDLGNLFEQQISQGLSLSPVQIEEYLQKVSESINKYQTSLYSVVSNYGNLTDDYRKAVKSYLEQIESSYKESIGSFTTLLNLIDERNKSILESRELDRQYQITQLDIYKTQIDNQASVDEYYKNSQQYVEDQLDYWNKLIKYLQEGSKEYANATNQIQNLATQWAILNIEKSGQHTDRGESFETQDELDADIDAQWEEFQERKSAALTLVDEITNSNKSETVAYLEQLDIRRDALKKALDQQLISYQQYEDAVKTLSKQEAQMHINNSVSTASLVSQTLDSIASGMDENNQKQFEQSKRLRKASATIDMLSGVTAAVSGLFTTKTGPWDIILAAAQAASIIAAGVANIKQIERQTYTSTTSASAVSATINTPTQISNAVQNANIESAVADTRVYVLESDIQNTSNRVSVQEAENRY